MASEVKFRIVIPGKIFITKAMNEDIFTRYTRGDFLVYQSDFVYYDTPDWDLAENSYLLRVCTSNNSNAATLRTGSVDQKEMPGLYTGQGWLTYFESPETIVDDFLRRGAYRQFGELASRGKLDVRFTAHRTRRRNNLYLPERTRLDLCLDDGEMIVDSKNERTMHMSLTLSYGDMDVFKNYCQQIIEEFTLNPDLTTTQEKALRLLRSR